MSRGQLRDRELSDRVITRLVRTGALETVARGVFVVRGTPRDLASRLWIAVLATGGVLGFSTSAYLWRMGDPPARISVIIPPERRVTLRPDLRVHRLRLPSEVVVRLDGIPTTNRGWTLMDQLGTLAWPQAVKLADRALQRSWLSRSDIQVRLDRFPDRSGNAQLRRILAVTGDRAAAESERRLHRLLQRAGIGDWMPNHEIRLGGRIVAVVDLALPARKLAIEIDGWAFHTDAETFQRDRTRQNALVALGWTVLRFTWADVVQRPEYVLTAVRAA